jgi:tripartite-type tricarboxylate transporter receptor subunit TctC
VRSEIPVNNAVEFVKYARGKQLNYASSSPGPQVVTEIFNKANNIGMVNVSYKGEGPAMTDLLGGHIQVGLFSINAIRPHLQSGKIKPMRSWRTRGCRRCRTWPRSEQGFKEITWTGGWYAFMAPAGAAGRHQESVGSRIQGHRPTPLRSARRWKKTRSSSIGPTPTRSRQIPRDMETWSKLLKQSGVTVRPVNR